MKSDDFTVMQYCYQEQYFIGKKITKWIGTILSLGLLSSSIAVAQEKVWGSNFDSTFNDWRAIHNLWGSENMSFHVAPEIEGAILRVAIHKGGIDPGTMRKRGVPVSGAGFKAIVIHDGTNHATLSYSVRFPIGFPFVKGGKLPGLFGGAGNSGGHIPNGKDGFSFRLMWLTGGSGQIYAYLPTSVTYGTSILARQFRFQPGRWHRVTQELILNDPNESNGIVKLWIDNAFVGETKNLDIRKDPNLKIDGIFFDFFFGGNDDSWAAPFDTYVDFSQFIVRWK